jgi:hypothetical protein
VPILDLQRGWLMGSCNLLAFSHRHCSLSLSLFRLYSFWPSRLDWQINQQLGSTRGIPGIYHGHGKTGSFSSSNPKFIEVAMLMRNMMINFNFGLIAPFLDPKKGRANSVGRWSMLLSLRLARQKYLPQISSIKVSFTWSSNHYPMSIGELPGGAGRTYLLKSIQTHMATRKDLSIHSFDGPNQGRFGGPKP